MRGEHDVQNNPTTVEVGDYLDYLQKEECKLF